MKKFIFKKKLDTKGFNLFSSVVAAVLIMSGVVLVNTLISTEEKTGNQIYFMINSFRLNDAAALARADSLQNFNYYFRESMQDWLTFDSTRLYASSHPLINENNYDDWDDMVDNFETVILLKDNSSTTSAGFDSAVDAVARKTVEKFKESYYGRYHVTLNDTSGTARDNIKYAINEALRNSGPDEDFFEVIECDLDQCEGGAFYFNIPLEKLSDASYEKLPRIIVKDTVTDEEIRTPILPKSRLRIYVPLRFFKALHLSMKRAEEIFNSADDDLSEAKLGFCDNSCVPRRDPLEETDGDWTKNCPTDTAEGITQELTLPMSLTFANSYKVGGFAFGQLPLNYFSISKICMTSPLTTDNRGVFSDFFNYQTETNNGLLTTEGRVNNCPYQEITTIVDAYTTRQIFGSSAKMYCSKIKSVEAELTYKETNKNYVIKGNELFYKIQITTGPYSVPNDVSSPPQCISGNVSGGSADKCDMA